MEVGRALDRLGAEPLELGPAGDAPAQHVDGIKIEILDTRNNVATLQLMS
jgi:hypothetical protein